MRLKDLDGELFFRTDDGSLRYVKDGEAANGVMFKCPGCWTRNGGREGTHMVLVYFQPTLYGAPLVGPSVEPHPRWQRTGETLDTLTLSPSINIGANTGDNCWHGWVRNGDAT